MNRAEPEETESTLSAMPASARAAGEGTGLLPWDDSARGPKRWRARCLHCDCPKRRTGVISFIANARTHNLWKRAKRPIRRASVLRGHWCWSANGRELFESGYGSCLASVGEIGHGYDRCSTDGAHKLRAECPRREQNECHRADAFATCFCLLLIEDWRQGGFGFIVPWPFCEAKCPFVTLKPC